MTKIRVLFNTLEVLNTKDIFPKVKSLGINAISVFGDLGWEKLPDYFENIGKEFKDVNVNLYHIPTYENEVNWQDSLLKDAKRIITLLAQLGINNYCWMIECNLYGYKWNPLVGKYVHRDEFVENFNYFCQIAHSVNKNSNVIFVPYPHPLMNLNCGIYGWRDWFKKFSKKLNFDNVGLNCHIGVWIPALNRKMVYNHLINSIKFLKDLSYQVSYVEVGYPTTGFKPILGLYGWGREKDQVNLLKTCYETLNEVKVSYMQICEFIDPKSEQVYEKFFGDKGKIPKFLRFIPVLEERHWGLLKNDGTEKKACEWIREITQKMKI